MKARHVFATVLAGVLFSLPAQALIITLEANLNGANEVPPADPDGTGFATFTIDTVATTISWAVTAENIDPGDSRAYTHGRSGRDRCAAHRLLGDAQRRTLAVPSADLAVVIADPSAFYYNVHTDLFQGGAIRGQLEFVSSVAEPGTAGLLLLGLIGAAGLRRRA